MPTYSHRGRYAAVSHEAPEAAECQVLETITELVARQRAAILTRDARAMEYAYEALLASLADLEVISRSAGGGRPDHRSGGMARIHALALSVRAQIAINRSLLCTGMAVADHFVGAAGDSVASSQALFSGVG